MVAVAAAAVAVVAGLALPGRDGDPGARSAAEDLVRAWERSRAATFVARGTWERVSERSGSRLASEAYLAQRPPDRLQRELGGVQGRAGDRLLLCPAGPGGAPGECHLGEPTGEGYDEAVAAEVDALTERVLGEDPRYEVRRSGDCFVLDQLQADRRAPYGVEATFCFDPATGTPTRRQVHFAEGVVETVVYDDIRPSVSDADLRP